MIQNHRDDNRLSFSCCGETCGFAVRYVLGCLSLTVDGAQLVWSSVACHEIVNTMRNSVGRPSKCRCWD